MRIFLMAILIGGIGFTTQADEPKKEEAKKAKVTGEMIFPKDVPTFEKRTLEIRLYSYDPRIADKAADLVEKIELKDFGHKEGEETKKEFTIGAKADLMPNSAYYLTFFVLNGDKRTHMGECEHAKNNLAKVLTNGQPDKVKVTFRAVK